MRHLSVIFITALLFAFPGFAGAQEASSASFKIEDAALIMGGRSISDSFSLDSLIFPLAAGASVSSSFGVSAGFLYFPFVSTPVVSATGGDAQVALSWTAASGVLGWTVGGYTVGQSTASGGPYSYTSVGNSIGVTRAGFTNGTAYYFVILVDDVFGNHIATSTEVTATPTSASEEVPSVPSSSGGGGGGGGGGSFSASRTTVNFSGRAYPGSKVTLLKDAQIAVQTFAGPDSKFQIGLSGMSGGSYVFSIYGEDSNGFRSAPVTFPVTVSTDATTNISGVFLTPTISVDKAEVRKGDTIAVFGQSSPGSQVLLEVNSEVTQYATVGADNDGVYLYNLDTSPLEYGRHSAKAKARVDNEASVFSKAIGFSVGNRNVALAVAKSPDKGDVNGDGKVNLIDFSIVAYWYQRATPPALVDFNSDGKVNLVDFSIMAFYWTG